jgi:hypothetical protein
MVRYVRTPNDQVEQFAGTRLTVPQDAIASLLQRRVSRHPRHLILSVNPILLPYYPDLVCVSVNHFKQPV